MDGVHDLGGVSGFGKIVRERNEPAFHERWEASVFTMIRQTALAGIRHNTDQFRHAVERIDPQCYLEDGYYGRWLGGLEALLVEAGILSQQQISQKAVSLGANPEQSVAARPASPADEFSEQVLRESGAGSFRPAQTKAAFKEGDWVRTLAQPVKSHTRLPAYARNKHGRVVDSHLEWVLPDTNAHGLGEQPQHLYTVEFSGEELWGAAAEANTFTSLDLFQPYLSEADND